MKYICLGYMEPGKSENMSESERNTMLDECVSYNDDLQTYKESSEAKKSTALATSFASPQRASGTAEEKNFANLADSSFTRMLRGGAVGAALLKVALKRKWVIQDLDGRALTVTNIGRREMLARFDL